MFNQSTLEAHNVQRPWVSSRAPAEFMKHRALSAEQGAAWDWLLWPPGPGGTRKSAREEGPASLAQDGRKGYWVY